ncbi:hypothetical protein [Actinomadura atramentaria]|uniref:hypothetical protein n=1 Tax=Actinomadura atramentaria TaxID=1990 RepID=UPI001F0A8AA2|nr:hypothetical protein [Actinomadura atramentaria]
MSDAPFSRPPRLLAWAVHGTFAVLLSIALSIALADAPGGGPAAGGALLGALYAAGVLAGRRRARPRAAVLPWLGAVAVGWAALAFCAPAFVYLAFPLFFVCLYTLPLRAAIPCVVLLTPSRRARRDGTRAGSGCRSSSARRSARWSRR